MAGEDMGLDLDQPIWLNARTPLRTVQRRAYVALARARHRFRRDGLVAWTRAYHREDQMVHEYDFSDSVQDARR